MCRDFDWQTELKLLTDDVDVVTNENINKFAESELPNKFFLQQFTNIGEEPFCHKKYWKAYAEILISRGISRIADVREDILIWLQDINWPGSDLIWSFVLKNFSEFSEPLKKCINLAISTDDSAWFNTLLSLVYKSKGYSDKKISEKLSKTDYSTNQLYEKVDTLFK